MSSEDTIFAKFSALKELDVTDKELLEKLYNELLEMDLSTTDAVREFLESRDLIEKHIANENWETYFLKSTDLSNEEWKARYKYIEEEIRPLEKVYNEKLNKHFLASRAAQSLPKPFDVLRRNWTSEVELFHEENVELLKEMELTNMEISELQGKLTANWEGKEVPIPFLYGQFKKTDRSIRKRAMEAYLEANGRLVDAIDAKFEQLLGMRQRVAENAGYADYTDYRFKDMKRFDWDPANCFEFHDAVKKHLIPLGRALAKRRKEGLGLETLRPYDGAVDPQGRDPLKIYDKEKVEELIEGTGEIIRAVDADLYGYFLQMRDNDLFDLDARKNKEDIGYMVSYPVYEQASVFMTGTGLDHDLFTFLHELGHCFHYFLGKGVRPYALQRWTAEVAEVGSITMEFVGLEEMEHFLKPEDVERMKESRLRQVVGLFMMMAFGDEFQHWLYANPGHSIVDRRHKWLELIELYHPDTDRTGYEEAIGKTGWQFYHILSRPFYLIDYAISEILALTIWDRYKADPADAIEHYKRGCSMSGSRPVTEIYEAFGSKFSFGEAVIEPLASRIRTELKL